jgi:hypothetical protein
LTTVKSIPNRLLPLFTARLFDTMLNKYRAYLTIVG